MIDTHALYKHFLSAGFDERKSEVLTESMLHYTGEERINKIEKEQGRIESDLTYIKENMVTRAYIQENFATKLELARLETRLETKMEAQKSELIKWMAGLIIASAMLPHLLKGLL